MQVFQIFYGQMTWKGCPDRRPFLIVECDDEGVVRCFPISGECYQADAFFLDSNDPDFAATGLAKSCYIHDECFYELHCSALQEYKGVLQGDLLRRFLSSSGLADLLPDEDA